MPTFYEQCCNADILPPKEEKIRVLPITKLNYVGQMEIVRDLQRQFPGLLNDLTTDWSNPGLAGSHGGTSLLVVQTYWLADNYLGVALLAMDHGILGIARIALSFRDPRYLMQIERNLTRAAAETYDLHRFVATVSSRNYVHQSLLLRAGYRPDPGIRRADGMKSYVRVLSQEPQSAIRSISLRECLQRSERYAEIIHRGCYQLYVRSFPDPEEQETMEMQWNSLCRKLPRWDIIAVYKDASIIGARHLALFHSHCQEVSQFAVGEYLYIDRSVRRQGYGRILIRETERLMESWNVRIILSEQKDPFVMNASQLALDEESGISTLGRLKFWDSMGYECCDELYFSPPVEVGKKPSFHYRLAVKRLDQSFPRTISLQAYLSMLKAYHESWVDDWEEDPTTLKFKDILKEREEDTISLIALLKERSRTTELHRLAYS